MDTQVNVEGASSSSPTPPPGTAGGSGSTDAQNDALLTEGEHDAPTKKKRKQLVACDSCRLRRVRCNKADVPPGRDCAECERKQIKCTDTYIKSKPRVSRSGKLIQQAKVLYGDGDFEGSPLPSPTTEGYGPMGSLPVVRSHDKKLGWHSETARALSEHLILTFREMVHKAQMPAAHYEHFEKEWESSGRNSREMSPSGQAMAFVMEAWGSRFSNHPAILGPGAPTLEDVSSGSQKDFSSYGQMREHFVRNMIERAVRALDEAGSLRKASNSNTAALLMLEFLSTWGDVNRVHGRPLMTAAVEHLRSVACGTIDDPTEEVEFVRQQHVGGMLFWIAYTRDAVSAAFGGRSLALSSDDLALLCSHTHSARMLNVAHNVKVSDPMLLATLTSVSLFNQLARIGREVVVCMSGPMASKARLDVGRVRGIVDELHLSSQYTVQFMAQLNKTNWTQNDQADTWCRDYAALRAQTTLAAYLNIVHRIENEREAKNALSGLLFEEDEYSKALSILEHHFLQLLTNCGRELILAAARFGDSRIIKECTIAMEYLPFFAYHLIQVPSIEEGGHTEAWTLEQKYKELSALVKTMKITSWAWADYGKSIQQTQDCIDGIAAQLAGQQRQQQHQQRQQQQSDRLETSSPGEKPAVAYGDDGAAARRSITPQSLGTPVNGYGHAEPGYMPAMSQPGAAYYANAPPQGTPQAYYPTPQNSEHEWLRRPSQHHDAGGYDASRQQSFSAPTQQAYNAYQPVSVPDFLPPVAPAGQYQGTEQFDLSKFYLHQPVPPRAYPEPQPPMSHAYTNPAYAPQHQQQQHYYPPQ